MLFSLKFSPILGGGGDLVLGKLCPVYDNNKSSSPESCMLFCLFASNYSLYCALSYSLTIVNPDVHKLKVLSKTQGPTTKQNT